VKSFKINLIFWKMSLIKYRNPGSKRKKGEALLAMDFQRCN
jgi:hypothetical protein